MKRRLGSGSASAATIARLSAFATMTRSVSSASSADRRSTCSLASRRTIRASAPSSPLVSPTTATRSPTTMPRRPSSRALTAVTVVPVRAEARDLESAAVDGDDESLTAASCAGRCLDRGRFPRGFGRTFASDSSYSLKPRTSRRLEAEHRPPHRGEVGHGLRGGADVDDARAGHAEPHDRGERRHAVVVVRVDVRAVEPVRGRGDAQRRRAPPRTRPPMRRISVASAARRSVSCPRRWPMPVRYDGPSASAHRAAMVGVISPAGLRSASMPRMRPVPVTDMTSPLSVHVAPIWRSSSG